MLPIGNTPGRSGSR